MAATQTLDAFVIKTPYAEPYAEVVDRLESSSAGLSDSAARERLVVVGLNELPQPKKTPAVFRFLAHFNDTLIIILLAAAAIKAIMGDWLDVSVILGVAIINAAIGFFQEGQAEKALAGIREMLSADASVLRDGQWQKLPASELVPGDIVRLAPGDKVPADLRLGEAHLLRIEEAALTGESVPSSKSVEATALDAGVGDRSSMAFSGTIVVAGQGVGVVTGTGINTEIGRIQKLVGEADSLATPLTKQLDKFGKILTIVVLGMAAVMMLIGRYLHQMPFDELVSAAIGFAVAAIPEGLPALVTITLALGVRQMAKRRAITRKLTAVETVGSVTAVCSDKTGTLTKNEMTVREIVTAHNDYESSGLGYEPVGEIVSVLGNKQAVDAASAADLAALLQVAALCNDAHVRLENKDGAQPQWKLVGEPTEGALRVVAMKAGFGEEGFDRLAVIPFDSEHKLMATLNQTAPDQATILVKGAPDRILSRATKQLGPGGSEALDEAYWLAEIDRLSAKGLRVLAAARRPVASPTPESISYDDLEGLEFLGLWGIVDPPRPEAIEAIADCHRAGIRVKMITGDHAGTALAIAQEMGIVRDAAPEVLTGAELEELSQEQLKGRVRDVDVYARTSPEHKIRIVRALQSHGEVVAMTGDGVNDAPALTRADVGIAMGIKGTEATKEAAEIVLADDNFATIRSAIREGRRIYDNLRKAVVFLLPTNGAQSLVILVAVLFGLALPLTPVQVLWVNMVTSVTLSLALAYEPAERGIMSRKPRQSGGSIISAKELIFVALVSLIIGGATLGVFYSVVALGMPIEYARTEAVTMLALGQLAYLFNCRFMSSTSITTKLFKGNPVLWWCALSLIVLQLGYTYLPFMNDLFGSTPLTLNSWLIPAALAVVIFLLIELIKLFFRDSKKLELKAATPAAA